MHLYKQHASWSNHLHLNLKILHYYHTLKRLDAFLSLLAYLFFLGGMCVTVGLVLLAVCYHSWACHRQWEHVGCILMMSPHHAHCMANCLALSGEACGIGTTTMCPFVALNKEMFPNAPSSKKFKNLTLRHGCWGGFHPQFKAPFYFAVYFI